MPTVVINSDIDSDHKYKNDVLFKRVTDGIVDLLVSDLISESDIKKAVTLAIDIYGIKHATKKIDLNLNPRKHNEKTHNHTPDLHNPADTQQLR